MQIRPFRIKPLLLQVQSHEQGLLAPAFLDTGWAVRVLTEATVGRWNPPGYSIALSLQLPFAHNRQKTRIGKCIGASGNLTQKWALLQ